MGKPRKFHPEVRCRFQQTLKRCAAYCVRTNFTKTEQKVCFLKREMMSECVRAPEARAVLPANLQRLHRGPDPVFRAAWAGEKQWGGMGRGGAAGQRRQHLVEPNNISSGSISHTTHTSAGNVRLSASLTGPGGGGGGGALSSAVTPFSLAAIEHLSSLPHILSFWVRHRRSFVHK